MSSRVTLTGKVGDIVTLLPLSTPASGITTTGLAYELRAGNLALGSSRGVSNVMTESSATIEVKNGVVLLCHTPSPA